MEETKKPLKLTVEQKSKLPGNAQYEVDTVDELVEWYNRIFNSNCDMQFYMKDYLCAAGRILTFQQIRDEVQEYSKLDYKDRYKFCKEKVMEGM